MANHLIVRTSRYQNPLVADSGLAPIGITRHPPRFPLAFDLIANLYTLAPTSEMLQEVKANRARAKQKFLRLYRARLDAIGIKTILASLRSLTGGTPGVVLLCYEDLRQPGQSCHRRMLADWLEEHAGLVVDELEDTSRPGRARPAPMPTLF